MFLISLGCSKNLVDSERLAQALMDCFSLKLQENISEANLILINTCAFIEPAVEEAIETIFEVHQNKKKEAKIVVMGCLPSRFGNTLSAEFHEVDLFIPPSEYNNLTNLIAQLMNFSPIENFKNTWPYGSRFKSTPFFKSYLKISEGCDNNCSYCLIPSIRGPLKSFSLEALICEAKTLVESGVKELTLIAQDITAYGRDLKSEINLKDLIAEISKIQKLKWIRLMYAYPEGLNDNLIKYLAQNPKVVPYLDLPLQHVNNKILNKMGRGKQPKALSFIENIRNLWPKVSLRSTLMVGFPGETEKEFNELIEFVKNARLDHLGAFAFFPEDSTLAADFKEQVPQAIKEERLKILMEVQKDIAWDLNQEKIGNIYSVLVEDFSCDSDLIMVGRTSFQAPKVDGLVYFSKTQPKIGQILKAKVVDCAGPYDLIVEINND